ncbi:uncharacterized protein LOC119739989 [Patiria miniata]|uniref:CxC3 like cysteine cluster domain-containing protein n=1 Tax=Patiria miniata TaxID=46514 RepID=A0A914B4U4_PATMI|nr:uncharacterized protein LOC119739989 [Patiria miniata]
MDSHDPDDDKAASSSGGHGHDGGHGAKRKKGFFLPPKRKTLCKSTRPSTQTSERRTKTKYRNRRHNPADGRGAQKTGQDEQYAANVDLSQGYEMLQASLEDLIRDTCPQTDEASSSRSSWSSRMEAVEGNWKGIRPLIFQHVLESQAVPIEPECQRCENNQATVRCTDCPVPVLCSKCDVELHTCKPFHHREMWMKSYFERIPPCQTVVIGDSGQHLQSFDQYFPVKFPRRCQKCSEDQFETSPTANGSRYIVLTLQGRYDLRKHQVRCSLCGFIDANSEVSDIIANGFFPGNPKNIGTIVEVKLLRWIDLIMSNMPGTSLSAFAKVIEDISIEETSINRTMLSRCLSEYRYCERELALCQGLDDMKCPPCAIKQHSAHVDGNFKVYRYSKVPKGIQKPYFSGTFIEKDSDVSHHMDKVYTYRQKKNKRDKEEDHNSMCGKTTWKAARVESKSRSKLDEAGLDVAGCRHSIAQKAVNMFTGEKYGYPHYLHVHFLLPKQVTFLWLDVACKYFPWARQEEITQLDPSYKTAVTDIKPALSVMHAKAHSWDCQVLWGGRNQDGAGAGAGEDMELFFSYLSRCGSTTKNMGKANREDTLTSHVLFWNSKKVEGLARQLCKRYEVAQKMISSTDTDLMSLLDKVQADYSNLGEWMREIRACAKDAQSNTMPHAPDAELERFFQLKQKLREIAPLQEYTDISSQPISLLLDSTDLYSEATKLTGKAVNILKELEETHTILHELYGVPEEELYQMGRTAAIEHQVAVLQDQVELHCQQIKRRDLEITKFADSSKIRKNLRQKNLEEKKKLAVLVDKLNSIQNMKASDVVDASVADALAGNFPWQRGTKVSWNLKKTAVDLWMLSQRNHEEVVLLKNEMKNYLLYFQRLIGEMEQNTAETETSDVALVQPWFEVEDDQETDWKYKAQTRSVGVEHGLMALRRRGAAHARRLLQRGSRLFQKVLVGDVIAPIEDDWMGAMKLDDKELSDMDSDLE